jgi:hypothetical protein
MRKAHDMSESGNNQLAQIIKDNQVEPDLARQITSSLSQFLEQAQSLASEAMKITVTSEDQLEEMKQAREKRLQLKKIRTETENARKQIKESIVRAGKAVDGAANIIKFIVKPAEDHLETQEKFVENLKAKRIAELTHKRTNELTAYEVDCQFFNLGEMSNEAYAQLLANSKAAFEAKKQAERKAQEEQIAREKAQREEQERIRQENEHLKAEAQAREKERAEQEAKLAAERQAQEEKLKAERQAREKAQAQLRAQQEAQARAKAQQEQRQKDEELARLKAEKQARLASDKEKLVAFANALDQIELPEVKNPEAQELIKRVAEYLTNLKTKLVQEAGKL